MTIYLSKSHIILGKEAVSWQQTSRNLDMQRKELLVLAHKSFSLETFRPIKGFPILMTVTAVVEADVNSLLLNEMTDGFLK